MRRVPIGGFSSPATITRSYRAFAGVDFSSDESQVESQRSPDMLNIISDSSGYPQKRLGWRTVATFADGINGIFPYKVEDITHYVVHAGTTLYLWDGEADSEPESLLEDIKDAFSTCFYFDNKLYILTGAEYLVYDGEQVANVTDDCYTPTTSTGRAPSGGGKAYEKVNLLSPKRRNKFSADGTAKKFQLDVKDIDEVTEVKVDGEVVTGWTVNEEEGTVTLATAPDEPAFVGLDNVEISFSKGSKPELVLGCTLAATYGLGGENRVFISGDAEHPNREYYSGLNDPSYFPDINYVEIGSADWRIMHYVKLNDELIVVKEDNRQEAVLWHHTATMDSNGVSNFPLRTGTMGDGAVSARCGAEIDNGCMFLSPRGVKAPVSNWTFNLSRDSAVKRRSTRVDTRLTLEPNLQDACATTWDGYYIVCVNNHCYVADTKQGLSQDCYEWYFWDNVPARVFAQEGLHLFFGTDDGRICRFNDDLVNDSGEIMMQAFNDDGDAIKWHWCTKMDDFGNLARFKNLVKRGCVLQLKTANSSSCDIYIRTEKDFGVFKKREQLGRFDFRELDFANFTFNTLPNNLRSLRTKVKKFQQLQIILKGEEMNQAFGVLAITLSATMGNPVK